VSGSRKKTIFKPILVLCVFTLFIIYSVVILALPIQPISPTYSSVNLPVSQLQNIAWPKNVESAIGVYGYGLLATSGVQDPTPTASIAKIITALCILQVKPIEAGQQGPILTLSQADVNIYNTYVSEGGSEARVASGEKISEYQALQAMLIPSADNMADSLAIWAFGSLQNYINYANTFTKNVGLASTTISDASGLSPQTLSTANDLITLGNLALSNPVIAQIVSQSTATVPVAGLIKNYNYLLGQLNIVGIKTGNTSQAGGTYLFAAKYSFSGNQNLTVIGAIMKAANLETALTDAIPLLQSISNQVSLKTLIPAGTTIGSIKTVWGQSTTVTTVNPITVPYLSGMRPKLNYYLNNLNIPSKNSTEIGSLTLGLGSSEYKTSASTTHTITSPSWTWKLMHPSKVGL